MNKKVQNFTRVNAFQVSFDWVLYEIGGPPSSDQGLIDSQSRLIWGWRTVNKTQKRTGLTCSTPGLSGLNRDRVSTCSGTNGKPLRSVFRLRSAFSATGSSDCLNWPAVQTHQLSVAASTTAVIRMASLPLVSVLRHDHGTR